MLAMSLANTITNYFFSQKARSDDYCRDIRGDCGAGCIWLVGGAIICFPICVAAHGCAIFA